MMSIYNTSSCNANKNMQKKKKNNQNSYFIGSIFAARRRKYSNTGWRKAMWNFNKKIPLRDSGKDRWNDVNVAFTDRIRLR